MVLGLSFSIFSPLLVKDSVKNIKDLSVCPVSTVAYHSVMDIGRRPRLEPKKKKGQFIGYNYPQH
jgi:hypothetical protein